MWIFKQRLPTYLASHTHTKGEGGSIVLLIKTFKKARCRSLPIAVKVIVYRTKRKTEERVEFCTVW